MKVVTCEYPTNNCHKYVECKVLQVCTSKSLLHKGGIFTSVKVSFNSGKEWSFLSHKVVIIQRQNT